MPLARWMLSSLGLLALSALSCASPPAAAGDAKSPPATPTNSPPQASSGEPAAMVPIPAGTLQRGAGEPSVQVAAFEIDRTEVTVKAYEACVKAGGCSAEVQRGHADEDLSTEYCNYSVAGRADHPINCIDWSQATAYCQWASKRLPTDEEWEYAARGSDGRVYPWGNDDIGDKACWGRWDARLGTCPAGSLTSGASPFGVLDMAGNVWEWTSTGGAARDSADRPVDKRSTRGGAWNNGNTRNLHVADSVKAISTYRTFDLGFRCAR